MSYKTLKVNTEAYVRLKKLKLPGESFSDVILRKLPKPWEASNDLPDREISPGGRIVKRGKLKVWWGAVPKISIEEAIHRLRR